MLSMLQAVTLVQAAVVNAAQSSAELAVLNTASTLHSPLSTHLSVGCAGDPTLPSPCKNVRAACQ